MNQDIVLCHAFLIMGYAFLSHAIILLDDGLHWDGWILDSWQRTRNWTVMKRVYSEVGLSPFYYVHKALAALPARIFVYRFIAFGSTLASGMAIYFLALQTAFLTETQSLLLALLYLSYTGYHMNVDTVVGVHYTFATALFYWAAYLALLSLDTGGAAWLFRIMSWLLFLAAFNANSTLVYYFGFLGLRCFMGWQPGEDGGSNAYRALLQNLDYLVLPFAYWILKNALTPRHGRYENYNRITLRPDDLALKLIDAIRFGFESAITSPIRSAIEQHYLWVPAVTAALAVWLMGDEAASVPLVPSAAGIAFAAVGAVLVILAALPYVLVGQNFFPRGWNTKHHMLFHLPVALIVLGTVGMLPMLVAIPAITFMLTIAAIHLNLTYLHHIGAAVKNRSWLYKLSRMEGARKNSIFLVTDRHSIRGDPCNPDQEHRPAYLFYMFEWLWREKTRCGLPVGETWRGRAAPEYVSSELVRSTLDYDMQQVDPRGEQARLIISDGSLRPPSMIPLFYLRRRWLRGGDVDAVLEEATELEYVSL